MEKTLNNISITLILKISTICLLLGRAWQHLLWHTPHSEVLWDETWWGETVNYFGLTWNDYANNYMNYIMIDNIVFSIGILYLLTGIVVIFYKKGQIVSSILLWLCFINLIFLSFCYMKDKSFAIGQFWEYTIQFITPILLWLWVQEKISTKKWMNVAKVAVALSFTCHGLYAVGFYPVPGNFIDMTISITGMQQSQTYNFLMMAGILDFTLAIGIFAPNFNIVRILLIYATFWGFSTSIARIWAYVSFSHFNDTFWQWAPHSLYRLPHAILPFAILVLLYILAKNKAEYQQISL